MRPLNSVTHKIRKPCSLIVVDLLHCAVVPMFTSLLAFFCHSTTALQPEILFPMYLE